MKPKSPKRTGKGFFKVPHGFFDSPAIMKKLTHAEQGFFVILCKLYNRYADEDGWFWHTDKTFTTKDGSMCGFEQYKLSPRVCKSARKKLVEMGLIETRRERSANGVRYGGTVYRLTCTQLIARTKGAKSALGRERNEPLQEHHPDPRIREINIKKKELIDSFNMNRTTRRQS
jgi:hypothetical protein